MHRKQQPKAKNETRITFGFLNQQMSKKLSKQRNNSHCHVQWEILCQRRIIQTAVVAMAMRHPLHRQRNSSTNNNDNIHQHWAVAAKRAKKRIQMVQKIHAYYFFSIWFTGHGTLWWKLLIPNRKGLFCLPHQVCKTWFDMVINKTN